RRQRSCPGSTPNAPARRYRPPASAQSSGLRSTPARSRQRRRRCWCARCSRPDSTPLLSVSAMHSTPSPPNEVLRWESPIQTFFRTTTRTVDIGGIEIPQDAKVLLFLACANRDPRRWDEPDCFDVNRRAAGHVAFGAGIHLCVGQMLARL